MRLTDEQVREYYDNGLLLIPSLFSRDEVGVMKAQLSAITAENSPRRVVEKDEGLVRSVYGSHKTNEVFGRLTRHPRILGPAMQILNTEVYVYQFKVNIKAAFGGDVWEWHQDFVFWRKEDGMQKPDVINVTIFLDDVTEFNGPLFLIPRSHYEGMIDVMANDAMIASAAGQSGEYRKSPAWITNLTADLKYALDKQTVTRLAGQHGIVAPKGPAGSVLFFHCNIVHGSTNNISPDSRVVTIITYNSVQNQPGPVAQPRPDFLVSRDARPLAPLSDDTLLT